MLAVILAGGYGTRLSSVFEDRPKCLAPIAGRALLTRLYEKLSAIPEVSEVVVSTNRRFEHLVQEWVRQQDGRRIRIVADDSYREEEKPGALRALNKLLHEFDADDIFVLAGDNIFTDSLSRMVELYDTVHSTVLGVYQVDDPGLVEHYSCVLVKNEDGRVLEFVEKPRSPRSSLIGTGIYLFPRFVLSRLSQYFGEAGNADSPGHFISWLAGRERVYAYRLLGVWFDVGTPETYRAAQDYFKGIGQAVAAPSPA